MTSVNVTTTKNTVTVSEGDTRIVTIKTQGPQGPSLPDGDKGDVTVSSNGTAISINNSAVTSAKIADGAIVNADINASAAIALSKLATGALPTAITVTSANISDLSIVDADISGSAAISLSKLATGALPTAITVTSANISDLSIVNADINASAAIAGTKISPDFGSQNIVTTGTGATGALGVTGNITVSGTVDGRDVAADGTKLDGIESGATADQTASEIKTAYESNSDTNAFTDADHSKLDGIESGATADQTKSDIDALGIAASTATTLATARTIAGTSFDGSANIDISYTNLTNKLSVGDGGLTQNNFTDALKTKLDGIETAATADQTAAEIKTLLDSNGIVNSNVDASAAIAGTKISPDFGSQAITTTGNLNAKDIILTDTTPGITFNDTNNNSDYKITVDNGVLSFGDTTNNANRVNILSNGTVSVAGNLDVGAGVDVTGNITVTGTVDGVDIATRDTLFGGLTSSSGVLTNGVTATTQSASDNSTKVATTAYTDTAISNLVNSAPSTLDTLKELSDALGSDPNFATTVTNSIATKLPLAGGTLTGNLTISNSAPQLNFTDSGHNPDYSIKNFNGKFEIKDESNGEIKFAVNSDGHIDITANTDFGAGIDVTGNITVTGTVDGRDIATDGTKLDGIEASATADQTASEIVALVADQTIAPSTIDMEDNEKILLGTGDDLEIYHDGSHSVLKDSGTGQLKLLGSTISIKNGGDVETLANFISNGSVRLFYDNSKKFETTSTGTLISGFADHRQDSTSAYSPLTAPSNVVGRFYNGSSTDDSHASIQLGSTNGNGSSDKWFITCVSDSSNYNGDLAFTTRTSASVYQEVLRFTNSRTVDIANDSGKLRFGASQDLQIYHNGSHSFVTNATGFLSINTDNLTISDKENSDKFLRALHDGAVELYYDNSKKLETTTNGITVTGTINSTSGIIVGGSAIFGDNEKIKLGNSNDLQIYHNGTTNVIAGFTASDINIESYFGADVNIVTNSNHYAVRCISDAQVELYYDNSKKLETTSSGVTISGITTTTNAYRGNDNVKLELGTGSDLQIYHDGTNSNIKNNTNQLNILGNDIRLLNNGASKALIKAFDSGAVELYFNGVKKAFTYADGLHIDTGVLRGDDNALIKLGNDGDLQIYHDSSTNDGFIKELGTGRLQIWTSSLHLKNQAGDEINLVTNENGNCELWFDNSKKIETTSYGGLVSGNLDATGNFVIPNDTGKFLAGASNDLQIYHDGTSNYIASNNGNIILTKASGTEKLIRAIPDGAVELYYDNIVRLMTNSTGAQVTGTFTCSSHFNVGDNVQIQLGNSAANDFILVHDGTDNIINCGNNGNLFQRATSIHFQSLLGEDKVVAETDGAVELYYDNSKKFETDANGAEVLGNRLRLSDNVKLACGAGADLEIYHDGSHSRIDEVGTGNLKIQSNNAVIISKGASENLAQFIADGAVELYHDNSKKFETTSGGVQVTDNLNMSGGHIFLADNFKLNFGTSDDLQIYHDGTFNYIAAPNNHEVHINANSGGSTENMAKFKPNGAVELYYDNSKKLETTANGLYITGAAVFPDGSSNGIQIGNSSDLQIYHNGSHSFLDNSNGTGNLLLYGNGSNSIVLQPVAGENSIVSNSNSSVELFFDNSKKFETTSGGVDISNIAQIGTSNDQGELRIGHDGTSYRARLVSNSSNSLEIDADGPERIQMHGGVIYMRPLNSEKSAAFVANGAAELYYDDSKKFETTSTGINIPASVPTITLSDTDGNTPYSRITAGGGDLVFEADQGDEEGNTLMLFRVDDSEKMRINSNGRVMINTTTDTFDGVTGNLNIANTNFNNHTVINLSRNTASDRPQIRFSNPNGNVGSITTHNSATSYNTSSDYRLKENVTAISDGITRLKTLKPYRFNFKADATTTVDGFFAHEVTAVPEAITGTKDEVDENNNPVYQGIDQSKLVPLLVAAVQELIGRVEKLEGA